MFRATGTAMMFRASAVLREQEGWRDQGITYLQYLNTCTEATLACLKPQHAGKAGKWATVGYHAQEMDDAGVMQPVEKVPNTTDKYGKNPPAKSSS
uniref:Uncharacterized protein n=1 Tax=Neobodo designis TaxID=312471 RepID=A0A7S1W2R5_NEODS